MMHVRKQGADRRQNGKGGVASPTPGTGIKSCGCFLPDLTRFTF